MQHREVASCSLLVVVGLGQEVGINVQHLLGIGVEDVEQIAARAVVHVEVVHTSAATLLQLFERAQFCPHEREDGLLLVAEQHHGVGRVGCQQLHKGYLQRVKVLHLVNLDPRIALEGRGLRACAGKHVVDHEQEVFKVEQMVLRLILLILPRQRQLSQRPAHNGLLAKVGRAASGQGSVGIGVGIDVEHGGGRELHLLHLAQQPQRSHIVGLQTVGVQAQPARMAMGDLVHERPHLHDLHVAAALFIVGSHNHLVVACEACENAHGIVVVDDGRVGCNEVVFKKKARAEPVQVAHIHLLYPLVFDGACQALTHAPCRAVGEGQTQHVGISHALAVGTPYAFGQDLRLSAARRSEHQVPSSSGLYHLLLTGVEAHIVFHWRENRKRLFFL